MTTALAKQLSTRMTAKNLSASMLEREAGLKAHAVLNILRGKSKKPSAEILLAISDILGCTVRELLNSHEMFQTDVDSKSKNELLTDPYKYPDLLCDTIIAVNTKIKQNDIKLTVQQVLTCVEQVYLQSIQKNPEIVDIAFTEWFMDLLGEQ